MSDDHDNGEEKAGPGYFGEKNINDMLDEEKKFVLNGDAPSALCFSGGGARSAAFCLGVLQSLAKCDWLKEFSYLSVVSGGGYIGAWVTAWIRQEKSSANVIAALASSCDRGIGEPGPIRRLRDHSSPLTPRRGFSGDTIALVGVLIRNLLIHWVMVLPLFLAIVWLYLASFSLYAPDAIDAKKAGILIYLGIALLILGFFLVAFDLPFRRSSQIKNRRKTYCAILLLAFAAFIFSICAENATNEAIFRFFEKWKASYSYSIAIAVLTAILILFHIHRLNIKPETSRVFYRVFYSLLGLLIGVSLSAIAAGLLNSIELTTSTRHKVTLNAAYAVLSFPVMLVSIFTGLVLLSAITSLVQQSKGASDESFKEGEREWIGRFGGLLLLLTAIYVAAGIVCVFVPYAAMQFIDSGWLKEGILISPALAALGGMIALAGAIISASGYFSKSLIGTKVGAPLGMFKSFNLVMLKIATIAFFASLMAYASLTTVVVLFNNEIAMENWLKFDLKKTGCLLVLAVSSSLFFVAFAYVIGAQSFSLHSIYGNRLIRAYLGARKPAPPHAKSRRPHAFTDFDPADDITLYGNARLEEKRPLFLVIGSALNFNHDGKRRHLRWQDRQACSFALTGIYSGSALTGYVRTNRLMKLSRSRALTLGKAMTISGAAAAPHMGYHSSRLISALLAFFNVRLGWWIPRPRASFEKRGWIRRSFYSVRDDIFCILSEMTGVLTSDSDMVCLSDGGHFDNLGLYEMIRRKCGRIVLVDATCDPEYRHEDLARTLRLIRVDFNVEIDFPNGLPTAESIRLTKRHYAVGRIRYGNGIPDATLIYIKPGLSDDVPLDVMNYAAEHADGRNSFPHQATFDQIYDEPQFESYRRLGLHSIERMGTNRWQDFESLPRPFHSRERRINRDKPMPPARLPVAQSMAKLKDAIFNWDALPGTIGAGMLAVVGVQALPDQTAPTEPTQYAVLFNEGSTASTTQPNVDRDNAISLTVVVNDNGFSKLFLPVFAESKFDLQGQAGNIVARLGQIVGIDCGNAAHMRITGFSSSSEFKDDDDRLKNLGLADERANAVKDIFLDEGVMLSAIDMKLWTEPNPKNPKASWGEMQAMNHQDNNSSSSGYNPNAGAMNRRVEVEFTHLGNCTMGMIQDRLVERPQERAAPK